MLGTGKREREMEGVKRHTQEPPGQNIRETHRGDIDESLMSVVGLADLGDILIVDASACSASFGLSSPSLSSTF